MADVTIIEDRLIELKERYLTKAVESENPMIVQVANEYHDFRNRTLKPGEISGGNDLILSLINQHNQEVLSTVEEKPTILCQTNSLIKQMKSSKMPWH